LASSEIGASSKDPGRFAFWGYRCKFCSDPKIAHEQSPMGKFGVPLSHIGR
jgi:hypothetical protein